MIGLRFFPLKSADVRGAGMRDEHLRTSAWEAIGCQFSPRLSHHILDVLRISKVGPNQKLVPNTPRLSFWTV